MSKYTHLSGVSLINNALLNKSTAFSASERYEFNLNGLIPNRIETLEEQVQRVKIQLGRFTQSSGYKRNTVLQVHHFPYGRNAAVNLYPHCRLCLSTLF